MAQTNVRPIREIRQSDLREYLEAKETYETLKKELKRRLETESVEVGEHRAELREVERKYVPWKRVVARLKGDGYVRQVQSSTKPTYVKQLHVK